MKRRSLLRRWLLVLILLLCGGAVAVYLNYAPGLAVAGEYVPSKLYGTLGGYPVLDQNGSLVTWLDGQGHPLEVRQRVGNDSLALSPNGSIAVMMKGQSGKQAGVTVCRRDGKTIHITRLPFRGHGVRVNDAGYVWETAMRGHFLAPSGKVLADPALHDLTPAATLCADPGLLPCWSGTPRLSFHLYDPARQRFVLRQNIRPGEGIPTAVFTSGARILTVTANEGCARVYESGQLLAEFPCAYNWQVGDDGSVWYCENGKAFILQWRREIPQLITRPAGDGMMTVWGDGAYLAHASILQRARLRQVFARVARLFGQKLPQPYGYRMVTLYRGWRKCGRFALPEDGRPAVPAAEFDQTLAFSKDGRYLAWQHTDGKAIELHTFHVPR